MAGEQHRDARGGPFGEHLAHGVHAHRVQPGERLVQNKELRIVHQRGGKLHALLVAVREGLELLRGLVGDAQALGPVPGRVAGVACAHAVQPAQELELLQHDHAGVEAALLRHVAEGAARLRVDVRAAPAYFAAVEGDHADDRPHRGRLAGAIGAEEAEDLAGRHGERQPVQGDHIAVAPLQVEKLKGPVGARGCGWIVLVHDESDAMVFTSASSCMAAHVTAPWARHWGRRAR